MSFAQPDFDDILAYLEVKTSESIPKHKATSVEVSNGNSITIIVKYKDLSQLTITMELEEAP